MKPNLVKKSGAKRQSKSIPSDGSQPVKKSKEEKRREKELKEISKAQQQKRDYLTREEDFNKASHDRGWKDWETWCEEMTVIELRDELKVVKQSVNHMMDKSDHAVATLREHRVHAAEQYSRNFQSHAELIDYVMELYKVFQNSAHQMYESDREEIISEFYKEAENRELLHQQRKSEYENFAHAITSLTKCRLQELTENFQERKVEIESDSIVRREDHLEQAKKRELFACAEIKFLINLFNKKWFKNRLTQYEKSFLKSEEADRSIDAMQKQTNNARKEIAQLTEELETSSRESASELTKLKFEHQLVSESLSRLLKHLKQEQLNDNEKMMHLVSVCDGKKKQLKLQHKQAERICTTMKICSKFEKLSDKLESFLESSVDEVSDQFFEKLSKVEADCVMMKSYKSELIAKNENLEKLISESMHNFKVRRNLQMLKLDTTPSIGQISQVSHQMPQIKTPIVMRKRWNLCKNCLRYLEDN